MRFPLSWERRTVLLINSKELKQVSAKQNHFERLAQLDRASHTLKAKSPFCPSPLEKGWDEV